MENERLSDEGEDEEEDEEDEAASSLTFSRCLHAVQTVALHQ